MPRKPKVFIGTCSEIATTLRKAQNEYDKGIAHVCEEDGNPYHSMLTWKESPNWQRCQLRQAPAHAENNDARATSTWKCPKCKKLIEGHTFSAMADVGNPICGDCDCDTKLVAVVIDGVSQKVK